MLKGYEAIYKDGRVEWVGAAPLCAHARVLVVVEEDAGEQASGENPKLTNGGLLADIIEKWDETSRHALVEKFGNPVHWQRTQRMDRIQPGVSLLWE